MAMDNQQKSATWVYRAGTKQGPSFDLNESIEEVWLVTSPELFFPLGQDLSISQRMSAEGLCLWMTSVSNLSKNFKCSQNYDGILQVELDDSIKSKDPVKEIQRALSSLNWHTTIVPKCKGGLSLMNLSPLVQAVKVYMKEHSPISPEELNFHAELKAASQWSCSDDYKQLVLKKVPDSDCRLKIAVKTTLITWEKKVKDLQERDSSDERVDNQLSDYREAIGVLKNYLEKDLLHARMAPALHVNFMKEHPSAAGTKLRQNGSPRKRKHEANGDGTAKRVKTAHLQRRFSPRLQQSVPVMV